MIPQEDKTALTEMLIEMLIERGIHFTPSIELRIDHLEKIALKELETNNVDDLMVTFTKKIMVDSTLRVTIAQNVGKENGKRLKQKKIMNN